MGYAWDITIPANTLESNLKEQTLKLHPGIITRVGCKFPAGCHGMVKVRIFVGGVFLLFPLSAGGWVTGDDEEAWYTYYYELTGRPKEVIFRGCSPGTTYPHTVTIRITVLPHAVASIMPILDLLTRLLKRLGVRV